MRPPYDDYCYECGGYGDDFCSKAERIIDEQV